jgi:hypothetical protein
MPKGSRRSTAVRKTQAAKRSTLFIVSTDFSVSTGPNVEIIDNGGEPSAGAIAWGAPSDLAAKGGKVTIVYVSTTHEAQKACDDLDPEDFTCIVLVPAHSGSEQRGDGYETDISWRVHGSQGVTEGGQHTLLKPLVVHIANSGYYRIHVHGSYTGLTHKLWATADWSELLGGFALTGFVGEIVFATKDGYLTSGALLTASNVGAGELSVLRLKAGEQKGRALAVGGKRKVEKPEGELEDEGEDVVERIMSARSHVNTHAGGTGGAGGAGGRPFDGTGGGRGGGGGGGEGGGDGEARAAAAKREEAGGAASPGTGAQDSGGGRSRKRPRQREGGAGAGAGAAAAPAAEEEGVGEGWE